MTSQLFTRIAILLLLSSPVLAQQYYRWVDDNGTVHFSESPPPGSVDADPQQVRASHLTRGLSGDSEVGTAAPTEAVAATPTASQTPGDITDEEQCQKIRSNLETLTNTPQVRRVDPDTGETRMLDESEHQQELERNRSLEQRYC